MFDHVTLHASDREASERFYETVLRTLGIERTCTGEDLIEWDDFSLARPGDGDRDGHPWAAPRVHGPDARARGRVLARRHALAAGHRDDGAPGERPVYHAGYYAAFVLDPDGNDVEVVNHNR